MENVIFTELKRRGYNVDVGVVEIREGDSRKKVEIYFIINKGYEKYCNLNYCISDCKI